jgi:glyoxylase-like metal-dependent hydrolase (beta-lactamase superfamily II)
MTAALATPVRFELLRVGYCIHPECVAMRGGRWKAIEFPALVGLIEHPGEGLMLYDTGYSGHFREATRRFPECLYRAVTPVRLDPEEELRAQLEDRGFSVNDVATILVSHFHADHVAGLRDFPSARFVAMRPEYAANRRRGRFGRARRAFLADLLPGDFETRATWAKTRPPIELPAAWGAFREGFDLLGDGSLVGIDLPGHTESQLGLAFSVEGEGGTFLVADACWRIEGLRERRPPSRLADPLFADPARYRATFEALCDLSASPGAPRIIPSHCATSWAGRAGQPILRRE